MSTNAKLSFDVLKIDCEKVAGEIEASLRQIVFKRFHKKGAVVGISGGIDSSCVAALCAQALGPGRVQGLLMPEGESAASEESTALGRLLAESQGLDVIVAEPPSDGCSKRHSLFRFNGKARFKPFLDATLVVVDVLEAKPRQQLGRPG